MAKKSLDQLKNMVDGWKNVFITDEEIEVLAKQREVVCNQCPHKRSKICGLCNCPLVAKLRAVEAECPDNRWEK